MIMTSVKEGKKKKKKKLSSHKVFGIETVGCPRQHDLVTRNVENIGGGFNVSPA